MKFTIGIDEVGRGPLAGPVSVCAFLADKKSLNYIKKNCSVEIKDSKKMTKSQRQAVANYIANLNSESSSNNRFPPLVKGGGSASESEPRRRIKNEKNKRTTQLVFDFEIISVSPKVIDNKGISFAIRSALEKALMLLVSRNSDKDNGSEKEKEFDKFTILLDGGLKAPASFKYQETIIKGDDKEIAISLASILAKEYRDDLMKKLSKKAAYAKYGFDQHVGYGTKKHRDTIKKFGLSDIHRKSFCKNIIKIS